MTGCLCDGPKEPWLSRSADKYRTTGYAPNAILAPELSSRGVGPMNRLIVGLLAISSLLNLLAVPTVARADIQYTFYSTGQTYLSDFGSSCLVATGVSSYCYRKAWSSTDDSWLAGTLQLGMQPEIYDFACTVNSGGTWSCSFAWSYPQGMSSKSGSTHIDITKGRYSGGYQFQTYYKCTIAWARHTSSADGGTWYYTSSGYSPKSCPQSNPN